ncbi:MAG: hypothetical protein JXA82_18175 [Sedimentisphaerales bacterium]|nr:hypothetical protein [Sedimentisphaerales bacterium]
MNMLFSAFGRDYRTPRLPTESNHIFYGMPPVQLVRDAPWFTPDYSAFILADKVIMDGVFFDRLISKPHLLYKMAAEFFGSAKKEGFIELVDFEATIDNHRELIDSMMERDLRSIEPWIPVLQESIQIWRNIIANSSKEIQEMLMLDNHAFDHISYIKNGLGHFSDCRTNHEHYSDFRLSTGHFPDLPVSQIYDISLDNALEYSSKRRKASIRNALQERIAAYLAYVNANIILSARYQAPIYDWSDFTPFYRDKFLGVGQLSNTIESEVKQLRHLFTLFFPRIQIDSSKRFFKILRNKRIASLRKLCRSAVENNTVFDDEFAKRTLAEVFKIDQKVSAHMRKVSWLTLPLGAIPYAGTFVQKALEESIGAYVTKKDRKPYDWFFVMSDLVEVTPPNS